MKLSLFIATTMSILLVWPFTSFAAMRNLKGMILLQVESRGEAWYVNPDDGKRAYLGRPDDAYRVMREFGLGIHHTELEQYLAKGFPQRLAGKIMLDVENHGEAYYVYPEDRKGHYLGNAEQAYDIMRKKGLGITDKNLSTVKINERFDLTQLVTEDTQVIQESANTPPPTIPLVAPNNSIVCNGKYWSPCSAGYRFYCPVTGDAQCLQDAPITQQPTQTQPSSSNTQSQQLREFYRKLNELVTQINEQQAKNNAAKKEALQRQYDCLLTPTTEDERVLDPATQDYLRKIRCGTLTESDKTSYELSRLQTSVTELKSKLETKSCFAHSLLDTLRQSTPPTVGGVRWEIRWDTANSGRITNSSGGLYDFKCEVNYCFAY